MIDLNRMINLPVDIHQALATHADATRVFGHLPPSHQREYLKWIAEAKKPETREKRIKDMLERLAAPKGA